MLDPHRLRIFRSVIAHGSIQAAAHQLGYTPSAVSQQVALLQRETGLTLFERSGRGIVPTSHGKALAAESDEVIASLSRLAGVVADLRNGVSSKLTVGHFSSVGTSWMPGIARRLMDEFPELRLELMLNEGPEGPESKRHAEKPDIDLVVYSEHFESVPANGYILQHLANDPYVAVLHREHPLAHRAWIELSELRDEDWVDNDFSNGLCTRIVMRACSAAGFRPRYVAQAQDHYTAIAFVASGVGVTVVPRLAAVALSDSVRVVRLSNPEPVRGISVLIKESLEQTPVVRRTLELLAECAGQLQPVVQAPAAD
ncbi:LysR family transcriptional regulator [Psychromicrobium sp. YIM B11713]|uniref:LysR family transcriptional regulator n=1 Tax=Psychromicrobium sp. YIM B11713 TaxID=3145233 RepID=UPI00374F07CE